MFWFLMIKLLLPISEQKRHWRLFFCSLVVVLFFHLSCLCDLSSSNSWLPAVKSQRRKSSERERERKKVRLGYDGRHTVTGGSYLKYHFGCFFSFFIRSFSCHIYYVIFIYMYVVHSVSRIFSIVVLFNIPFPRLLVLDFFFFWTFYFILPKELRDRKKKTEKKW